MSYYQQSKTHWKVSLVVIFILLALKGLQGQGCSDAGACSIGSLYPMDSLDQDPDGPHVKLSFDQNIGLGEKFTFISQTSLSVEHRPWKNFSYLVRVPYIVASGNIGNANGIGDVLVSMIWRAFHVEGSELGVLGGARLRSNKANLSFGGNPLPMAYQTSLGTYDIIAGIQYIWESWDFYMAFQHPFGRNQNEYLNNPAETDESKLYFESAWLKRGDDLAFRVRKGFELKNQRILQAGALAIYRLQESEIIRNDKAVRINNSSGLTLNLYATYSGRLIGKSTFQLTAAFPVIDRDYRADGLTRNFVINLTISRLW